MTQINTGGGEAAVTLTGGYPLEIIDPTDRRAVVTDMSRLFPGGQFSLEFTGPDRNALVYTSPDNAIKASRPLGSAAAQVVVAEGRRLELTAVRAYQEVARGIGDAESSDLDPAQPDVYATARSQMESLWALANRQDSVVAAELAGVPGVELTHVFGVLALAYGRSTPFEAAKCVLDGLAELREEAPGLVIPQ